MRSSTAVLGEVGVDARRRRCRRRSTRRAMPRSTARCSRACSATSARNPSPPRRWAVNTTARAASGSSCIRDRASRRRRRNGSLAAELTQTTRLFARCAARIEPEWIEAVAGERVTRDYFDAALGQGARRRRRERARAALRPDADRRAGRSPMGALHRSDARDVFIREALVAGELGADAPFARAQPCA